MAGWGSCDFSWSIDPELGLGLELQTGFLLPPFLVILEIVTLRLAATTATATATTATTRRTPTATAMDQTPQKHDSQSNNNYFLWNKSYV